MRIRNGFDVDDRTAFEGAPRFCPFCLGADFAGRAWVDDLGAERLTWTCEQRQCQASIEVARWPSTPAKS